MAAQPTALHYRPDIDGLRGLAVAMVVAYHAFPQLRTGGFLGVDVFFVISGYLITQLILRAVEAGTFSLLDFYRRRIRRIVPALLVVLCACALGGWLLLLPSELVRLGDSISWCVPFLANLYFAKSGGGYFDPAAELDPLLHLWSLGVEEQFYIAWPLLLAYATRRKRPLPTISALFAASLALSIWSTWHGTPHFYNPLTRAWELAAGGMLAAWQIRAPAMAAGRAPRHFRAWLGPRTILIVGLLCIVLGGVCWTPAEGIPGSWSLLPVTGAVLVIASGQRTSNTWFLASGPMVLLGKISYPLYLWHWPVLAFTHIVLGHDPGFALAALQMSVACLAAYGTWRLIERPIRFGELRARAVPPLLAGLGLLTLAGFAFSQGWISGRLSGPLVARWNAAVTDWHYPGEDFDPRSGFGSLIVRSHRASTAVFIGDSHIQQYWPRVQRDVDLDPATARSAVFAAVPACAPLPGILSSRHKDCRRFFDYGLRQAHRPDVDTVVFGAFWELYFLGEYSPQDAPRPVYSRTEPLRGRVALDSPQARQAFEQLQAAVADLVSSGRRVFIILSNPTSPRFNPHFPARLRWAWHLPGELPRDSAQQIDAAPFESFVAPVMSRLREIAERTGAQAIDPRATLCEGMLCPAGDADGFPLYVDSTHLNGANARERASFIDEIVLGQKVPAPRP